MLSKLVLATSFATLALSLEITTQIEAEAEDCCCHDHYSCHSCCDDTPDEPEPCFDDSYECVAEVLLEEENLECYCKRPAGPEDCLAVGKDDPNIIME